MSRSFLRSKYMRSITDGRPHVAHRASGPIANSNRQDEMPKNRPSKYILKHVDAAKVDWLQRAPNYQGHKPKKGGRRMVNGIVRAKEKREAAAMVADSMGD